MASKKTETTPAVTRTKAYKALLVKWYAVKGVLLWDLYTDLMKSAGADPYDTGRGKVLEVIRADAQRILLADTGITQTNMTSTLSIMRLKKEAGTVAYFANGNSKTSSKAIPLADRIDALADWFGLTYDTTLAGLDTLALVFGTTTDKVQVAIDSIWEDDDVDATEEDDA